MKGRKLQSGFIVVATQDGGALDKAIYMRLRQELAKRKKMNHKARKVLADLVELM